MATTRYETAATIVKDAAVSLGLPEVADPFSSTDAAQVRLCRLLTAAGRELVQMYRWPHLRKVCDITAATGDGRAWEVPADFAGIVQGTAWNQTTDEQILDGLTAEEWNKYEADGDTPSDPYFRIVQDVFAVIPTEYISDGDALQYEYHSKSWVTPSGGALDSDRVTAATDTVHFDSALIGLALRRAWMLSTGMDTAAVEPQYWQAIDRAKGALEPGRTYSLVPGRLTPSAPGSRTRSFTL